jgi:hypothetical protein
MDTAARTFAKHFYYALFQGRSVADSMAIGRSGVMGVLPLVCLQAGR